MTSVCYTCKKGKYFEKKTTQKKNARPPSWRKKIGKVFPGGPIPNLLSIKTVKPSKPTIKTHIELGEKFKNRYVLYYAAESIDLKSLLKIKTGQVAYDKFKNKGISKLDNKGSAKLEYRCPQSYSQNKITYLPHIHFIVSNKSNTKWIEKLYTQAIICTVNKKQVNTEIKNGETMIINSLPFDEYIKSYIPNSIPLPYTDVIEKVTSEETINYLKKILVHYPKIFKAVKAKKINLLDIPIIVYCYYEKCDASHKLIEKMWSMGFRNIRHYPGGIVDYNKK